VASSAPSSTSFRRIALATTATTYLLILVGGLVRASGAGLGCPDWPRCFGGWIPPASATDLPAGFDPAQFNATLMWTEYLNRLLGVLVGFLILATLISAIRHHRRTRGILWPTAAAFLLVGFQGWLGGQVVAHDLAAWIVTVHLIVALVIVSLLLYATLYASYRPDRQTAVGWGDVRLSWSAAALIALTLGQVALGAQVRGGVDAAIDRGLPRPEILATLGHVDLWHREMAAAVFGLTVLVAWLVWSRRRPRPVTDAAAAVVGLVACQIVLGAWMAYVALTPPVQVAHLTTSSLLLGAETVLFLLARWLDNSLVNDAGTRSVQPWSPG
jgi:cytochrome c oxidase assembly protein subunit 15